MKVFVSISIIALALFAVIASVTTMSQVEAKTAFDNATIAPRRA